jgi:prevent-host-death family protein
MNYHPPVRDTYSLYEAKAKFSAILRKVREGHTVIVSYHGEPVAEIRPLRRAAANIAARLKRLEGQAALVRPTARRGRMSTAARKPGALRRFLRDRDE